MALVTVCASEENFRVVRRETAVKVLDFREQDLGRALNEWWLVRRDDARTYTLLADYANQSEAEAVYDVLTSGRAV